MIIRIVIYLYAFFIIYMPRISDLYFGIPIELFSGILLLIISLYYLPKFFRVDMKLNKQVLSLIIGIITASIYFFVRAMVATHDTRLVQNLFVILQMLHVLTLFDIMRVAAFSKEDKLRVFLNLALFQGLIVISMLFIPSFRQVALDLYNLGREENVFITRMRIYGISNDYTYFTPIYHSIIASICFYFAVHKKFRYLYYLPFILITILLNGRFGLIIIGVSIALLLIQYIMRRKISIKFFILTLLSILMLYIGLIVLRIVSPFTYDWIIGGIESTLSFIFHDETIGTFSVLESYTFFPKGKAFIFGEGFRVYGALGYLRGYSSSDIGYVNDMFMGGVVYVSILYGSIIRFLWPRKQIWSSMKDKNKLIYILGSYFLIIAVLIANYKGEAMRGGLILIGAIIVKIIISEKSDNQEIVTLPSRKD